MASYLNQAVARLREFEGSVPWMYLDTVGKVTVGVGLMLPDVATAVALPFLIEGRPATAEEIRREFTRVSALAKGKNAGFYRIKGGLELSEQAIEHRLTAVLTGFEGYLRSHLPGYDALPDAAKLALLDMIYNLGPGKLFHEYPTLIAAIEKGDWTKAATCCARRGPAPARNAWTREQFQSAAKVVQSAFIRAEAATQESRWWVAVVLGAGALLGFTWWATQRSTRERLHRLSIH